MEKTDTNSTKNSIKVSIENDAPFGNMPYYNISFLSATRIEKLADWYPVRGFKVYNGYITREQADTDAREIKKVNDNHDIFVSEMGHVYAWDDSTKASEVDYSNDKMNELEKKRRENIDQTALMREQFKNELKVDNINPNDPSSRKDKLMDKYRNKLLNSGKISKQQYELAQLYNTSTANVKSKADEIEEIEKEIMQLEKDYLDESPPTGLKFGCLTVYSPIRVIGLSNYCFKIRGLFDSKDELDKRIRKLKAMYPNDRIYAFEVGKWCSLSEPENLENPNSYLNYLMKSHLDKIEVDNEEFEKRKNEGVKKNEDHAKLQSLENRQRKRAEIRKNKKQRKMAKNATNSTDSTDSTDSTNTTSATSSSTQSSTQTVVSESSTVQKSDIKATPVDSVINESDRTEIENLANFLDDPELRNRFGTNNNPNAERMEINLGNSSQ